MQNDVLNVFLFKEKHLCWNLFCNKVEGPHPCNFIKKETPTQELSIEYCKKILKYLF